MKKAKQKALELANELLAGGRPLAFVKFISGITLAEMIRQRWVYEVMIPDPKGWSGGDPKTGEGAVHNGHMLHTNTFRSVFPPPVIPKGKSNKQMKREERKGYFEKLRMERKQRWAAIGLN